MLFNAIRINKILEKISGFTVSGVWYRDNLFIILLRGQVYESSVKSVAAYGVD